MSEPAWEGDERRAIPIHILNHIDSRFLQLQEQIRNMQLSIGNWMEHEPTLLLEKCEALIDECIPTSPENTDATPREKRKEHRTAHARWMQEMHDEVQKWKAIRQEAIKWAVGAVMSGSVLWVLWSIQKYLEK